MLETVRSFDGSRIAYAVQGSGPAVLLLHGFAADHVLNWARPGVIDALTGSGRRVIATDARGHGASDKPHDPDRYGGSAMGRGTQAGPRPPRGGGGGGGGCLMGPQGAGRPRPRGAPG